MKRSFGFAALLAGMYMAVPAAHAQSAGGDAGFFVGAKAGQGYYSGNDSLSSNIYGVDLGYRWALGAGNGLGIEAGYVKPQTVKYNGYGWRETLDTEAYTLGVTYRLTFGGTPNHGHWYFAARTGLMHWKQKDQVSASYNYGYGSPVVTYTRYDNSGSGSYAGVGIGYDFNRNVGLGLHYDYYLADLYRDGDGGYHADGFSALTAALEVRF